MSQAEYVSRPAPGPRRAPASLKPAASRPEPFGAPSPKLMYAACAAGGSASTFVVMLLAYLLFLRPSNGSGPEPGTEVADAPTATLVASNGPGTPASSPPAQKSASNPAARPATGAKKRASAKQSPAAAGTDAMAIIAGAEPSVALIRGKERGGTGFLVQPGLLATNAHVVAGEIVQNLEIRFPSADEAHKGPLKGKLLYIDRKRDVALLEVKTDLEPLALAESYHFRKGEDVTVIGNPGLAKDLVLENAISRGVMSTKTVIEGQNFYQLGVSINPGNSGGPVLDSSGTVIGIATLTARNQEGLAFCIPVEDLQHAIARSQTQGTAVANQAASSAPKLQYGWKAGETYVYGVHIVVDGPKAAVELDGSSIYKVKDANGSQAILAHRGWLTARAKPKKGFTLNGSPVTPPNGAPTTELTVDATGNVVDEKGDAHSLIIGDLASLLIEPFPDQPESSWEETKDLAIVERPPGEAPGQSGSSVRFGRPSLRDRRSLTPSRPGIRNRPGIRDRPSIRGRGGVRRNAFSPQAPPAGQDGPTSHPAHERTTYSLMPVQGTIQPINKTYELATETTVRGAPHFEMTGNGTFSFDTKEGIPVGLEFAVTLVENDENSSVRLTVTTTCKLLSGPERELALRFPVLPPTALNPLDKPGLSKALVDLRSGDGGRLANAVQVLYQAAPAAERRSEVARALEKLLDQPNTPRSEIIRTLGVWGDKDSVPFLIAHLERKDFGSRGELAEALGRLGPDERTAGAGIALMPIDGNAANLLLRALGSSAETALVDAMNNNTNAAIRTAACQMLRELGTERSVPALEEVARRKDAGQLGQVALGSIQVLGQRWPEPAALDQILADLKADNPSVRNPALDRMEQTEPVESRRSEFARALEAITVESPDGGRRAQAARLLVRWKDQETPAKLLEKLRDPSYLPWREAIDFLKQSQTADAATAETIAKWVAQDKGLVLQALERMGPVAEPAVLAIFRARDQKDPFFVGDLCRVLGAIGTNASVTELKRLADRNPPVAGSREAQEALKQIREAPTMDARVDRVIAEVRSGDPGRTRRGVEQLMKMYPIESRRSAVARALEPLFTDRDGFFVVNVMKAAGRWGDDATAKAIVAALDNPEFWAWGDALMALGDLNAGEDAARAAARRLTKDSGWAVRGLKRFGPAAEKVLIAMLQSEKELNLRVEICRALGAVGGPESRSTLQALAQRSGDEALAREAEEALKAIAQR